MKSMWGMCFNWKVLVALGAVAAGVLFVAPGAAIGLLPILLLAACPLSMVWMMVAMKRGMGGKDQPATAESIETTRTRLAALRAEERVLEEELARGDNASASAAPAATSARSKFGA